VTTAILTLMMDAQFSVKLKQSLFVTT